MKPVHFRFSQLWLFILIMGMTIPLSARHLVGGDLTYRCLGQNALGFYRYEILLDLYRDCLPNDQFITNTPFDKNIVLGIFNASSNSLEQQVVVSLIDSSFLPLTVADSCVDPPTGLCYVTTTYRTEVALPPSSSGYYISWGRCCRNETILNIQNPNGTGIAFAANIPNTSLCNSSPRFNNSLPAFICVNDFFEFDHSALDLDGDSLVYKLTTPYTAGDQMDFIPFPTPPPYSEINWQVPFNTFSPMVGNPGMALNFQTGELTVRPTQLGQFVFSISVFEYRNGVLLSEVKRDIQVNVIDCPINFPPAVLRPANDQVVADTLYFFQGEENCFDFRFVDNNGAGLAEDLINVTVSGDILGGGVLPPPFATFPGGEDLNSPYETRLCWTPSCDFTGTGTSPLYIQVVDNNDCPGPNITYDTVYVKVLPGQASPPELRCVSVEAPNQIDLSWEPLSINSQEGFDAYYVYRNDGSGWVLIDQVTNPNQTSYTDLTAVNAYGQSYCYQLATAKICPDFFVSDPGQEVCSILATATYVSQIQSEITWDAYTGWDNPIYELFANDGTETLIADNLTDTNYLYTDCNFVGNFRVRTVDPLTGCEVFSAPTQSFEQIDETPAVVEFCRITVADSANGIQLEWIPSLEDDLTTVRLYRRTQPGGNYQLILESEDTQISTYTDLEVAVNANSYCYLLEYEDLCGNVATSGEDCSILLTGIGMDGQIDLSWSPYTGWDQGVAAYEIWDVISTPVQLAAFENQTTTYTNTNLPPNQALFCYQIIARESIGGCGLESVSNEICISFPPRFFVPNAFTPNGDGHNDQFRVKGIFIDQLQLTIFNRWGTIVYQTSSVEESWDGTTQSGGHAQEGVYMFVLEVTGFDGINLERSGSITLIR